MDVELSRAETELQREETSLHTELARLSVAAVELDKRLSVLKGAVAEAATSGARDPALEARLKAAAAPNIDPDEPFFEARVAREAAVKARKHANAQARTRVAALKDQLGALASGLQADEKAAEKLTGQARQRRREHDEASVAQTLRPGSVSAVQVPPPPPHPSLPPQPPPPPPAPNKAIGRMSQPAKPPQRHSQRVQMQAQVDLSSDNNFFNGFSSNISDGGLFVATVNLLPIGTDIDLTFTLPSGQKVTAHGQVRWVRVVDDRHPESFPGLGIQFTRLDAEAQDAINEFVASREPMFFVE